MRRAPYQGPDPDCPDKESRQPATRCCGACNPSLLLTVAVLLFPLAAASAQSTDAGPQPERETSPLGWIRDLSLPVEPAFPLADPSELCRDKPQGPAWIDRMQASLYRSMCMTAAQFDGFFGNARFDDEYQATHGSLAVGVLWDERDHFDESVRFRVDLKLPQMGNRLSAFVGKVDRDEFVTEQRDDFDTLPRQFGRQADDEVLLGVGYSQPGRRGGRFDASIGTRLDALTEPYVKGTYRIAVPLLERNLLRLRETVFWEDSERLGATTRFDLERLITDDFLARWTASATISQESEGVRWFSHVTLFQNLGSGRAVSYQLGVIAESDREVPITDYGLRLIYRRSIFDRDWLFLELRANVTWPRESLLESREPVLGAGVAMEMMFGERGN